MGQGNSEGTAPEENTSDAPQGQADESAPASPNGPTPTEADTATRRIPVVQPDQVEPAAADGPASAEGDDTPAEDQDESGVEGDPGEPEVETVTAAADEVEDADTESEPDSAEAEAADAPAEPEAVESAVTEAEPDGAATEPGAEAASEVVAEGLTPDVDPAVDSHDASEQPSTSVEPESADVEPDSDADSATDAADEPSAATDEPEADPVPESAGSEESTTGTAAVAPTDAPDEPTPAPVAPVRTPVADRSPVSEPDASDEPRPAPDDPFGDPRNSATLTGIAATTGETVLPETTSVLPVVDDTPAEPAASDARPTPADDATDDRAPVSGAPETTPILPVAAAAAAQEQAPDPTPLGAGSSVTEGSPLDVFESESTGKRRWWRPVLIVAGVLVVLGGAYVGGAYALADRVPRGTTVAGIEVGGMSAADARTALTDGLTERSTQPITVIAREVSGSVDPAAAGLSFDVEATVDSLTGVDLRPQRMWQHLAGGGEESPITAVDEEKLDAALTDLSGALTLAPVDGSVVFVDGQAQGVAAVDGWSLDVDGARSTLEDGWLTEALPIELPSDTVTPTITQDEVDRVVRDVASAVVSGPVTVGVAGQTAELPVDVLVGAASFVPQDDELVLQMDGASLVDQVITRTANLLTTAADAKFEFQNGAPVIVPGTPGTTLDPATLGTAVATAAESTAERTASVELVESDPAQSTEALQELGVSAAVSEFSTPLTSEPKRTKNITAGAAAINGTLIRPGETFSLTEALGPIDAAHGFVQAGAIVNGEHSDAWGGGLSQLSTTTFNAAFEAGMEDVEHTPHSEWFSRYPAGREATLYTGSIDMKWKNTTPYGVLVQAYVADGRTWVRLWSTPYYEVAISSGAKTNVVASTTVYNTSPTCSASSAGNSGFSISVTRTVSLNGAVQTTDNLSWRYKPQNRVVCGADPATAPPAG